MTFYRNNVDQILCDLEDGNAIFPGYKFVRNNNKLNVIGTGGFSTVYEVLDCVNHNSYALKVIGFNKHIMTSKKFNETVNLQSLLCNESQYICKIIAFKELNILLDSEGKYISFENVKMSSNDSNVLHIQFILMEMLDNIIIKDKYGNVSLNNIELYTESDVMNFALQIGQALSCAHNHNILHRDIKLENIFWDKKLKCYKLGDFGIAKQSLKGQAETMVYTDGYGAPEVEMGLYEQYDMTADIYSFGITLYLLLNNLKFPGSDKYSVNLVQYNPEFTYPAPAKASTKMTRIIRKMCQYNYYDRYQSVSEVLEDLLILKSEEENSIGDEEIELPDLVTETFKKEKHSSIISKTTTFKTAKLQEDIYNENLFFKRIKRKEELQVLDKRYNKVCFLALLELSILFTLLFYELQIDFDSNNIPYLLVFSVVLLVESILKELKEFHIVFYFISMIIGVYITSVIGINVPCVILLVGLVINVSVVTVSCAIATSFWVISRYFLNFPIISILNIYDFSWIIVVLILFNLNRLFIIRLECGKTTYLRAIIGKYVFDDGYILLLLIGIVTIIIDRFTMMTIPYILQQLHLFRVGIVSVTMIEIYLYCRGYTKSIFGLTEEIVNDSKLDDRGN